MNEIPNLSKRLRESIKEAYGLKLEGEDKISIMMNQLAESEKRIEENREIKYSILNSGWDINMLGLLIPDLPPIELKTLLYTDYKFSDKQKEVIRYYITINPYI